MPSCGTDASATETGAQALGTGSLGHGTEIKYMGLGVTSRVH
jgi:hypothetical protein